MTAKSMRWHPKAKRLPRAKGAPMVTIRLSKKNAWHLALNIDGWMDAGACKGGLDPDERKALRSAYEQILRQVTEGSAPKCDCQNPEPKTGVALVSEDCPIHAPADGWLPDGSWKP